MRMLPPGSPNGPLNSGATARERGVGRAFGFPNTALGGMIDYNLANAAGNVITFEGRSPYLGFDVPEAILLGNSAFSHYHSAQLGLDQAVLARLEFNLSYTYSKSMDNASADPGSTAGSGKPDLPNVGFTAQGNAFDTRANYAPFRFRPHASVQRELRVPDPVLWFQLPIGNGVEPVRLLPDADRVRRSRSSQRKRRWLRSAVQRSSGSGPQDFTDWPLAVPAFAAAWTT